MSCFRGRPEHLSFRGEGWGKVRVTFLLLPLFPNSFSLECATGPIRHPGGNKRYVNMEFRVGVGARDRIWRHPVRDGMEIA